MKKLFDFLTYFLIWLLAIPYSLAQEKDKIDVEESAEVFLQEYSDEFQENFFEALKQKGIENYDKAVNLLLVCKQIQPDNVVVDHELAKAYLADKEALFAQEYALEAVSAEPDNLWYLETLMSVLQKQNASITDVETAVPMSYKGFQENLARIYYSRGKYDNAKKILSGIEKSEPMELLSLKVEEALKRQSKNTVTASFTVTNNGAGNTTNPMMGYKLRIEGLIRSNNTMLLQQLSGEALENYPSQPFFYYAKGLALNKKAKHREAIDVLESGLDFLINDIALANKMYQQLGDAYNAMGNSPKANMYLRKIKPGF